VLRPRRLLTLAPSHASAFAIGASLAVHVGVCAVFGVAARPVASPAVAAEEVVDVAPDLEPAPSMPPSDEPLAERTAVTAIPAPSHAHAPHTDAPAVHAVAATETKPAPSPAAAPVAVTSDDALPHFTLVTSNAAPSASAALPNAAGTGAVDTVSDDDATYGADAVDVPARAISQSLPRYPPQAQAEGREATVALEIVLSKTGAVESVSPLHPAGHGFDEEALAFARRTRFSPAMKRGRPVSVRMLWTVRFELQ
jgi:TonB family protein